MSRISDLRLKFPDQGQLALAAKRLSSALKLFRESAKEIRRRAAAMYPRLLEDAEQLGRMGWTTPMWTGPVELQYLVHTLGPEGVDDFFLKEYGGPESHRTLALLAEITSEPLLIPWRDVLEQAASAYRAGLHLVVVPALLPVLEGAVAAAAGQLKKGPRVVEQSKKLVRSSTSSVDRIVLVSVDAFVQNLFAYQPFRSSPPASINRHWILHGRSPGGWTQADALRLFQALSSLAAIVEPPEPSDPGP